MSGSPPLRLTVRLTPRGGRDAIDGWSRGNDGRPQLRARVAAAPVDGAANAALARLISKALNRPGRSVRIVGGEHGRMKRLEIAGADEADLHRAFGEPD